MINALRLAMSRPRALPSFDPAGVLLKLDAAYRERRKLEELSDAQMKDIGVTRADIDRILKGGRS